MCIKKITPFVTAVLMAFAACAGNVEVTRGSVTVRLDGDKSGQPRLVRLQVLGDKIVRVSATPEKTFADAPSLVVIPQPPYSRSDIREDANEVVISTPSVRAYVNKQTGEVRFTDAQGKLYVEENHGCGKTFEPFRASQTTATDDCYVLGLMRTSSQRPILQQSSPCGTYCSNPILSGEKSQT
ncbi:MAG: DUF4968 domain-containing protein [Bacteroidales bacterium]|nr:DUF4968 domain-containing protein [Candidatus Sodaliphilus limicaballi]